MGAVSVLRKAIKRVGLLLAIEPTWGGAFHYDLAILDAMAQHCYSIPNRWGIWLS